MAGFEPPNQDWALIERFQAGDRAAFETLFDRHKGRVVGLAYRFVQHRELAEDIAQEVFLKLYERHLPVRRTAKFSTWLYRVTVNAALDALRKRRWRLDSLEAPVVGEGQETSLLEQVADPTAASPDEVLQREELQRLVRQAINRLPMKWRAPLLLHQFEELSYAEIAQILGTTAKAVEKRLYHARERLRTALGPYLTQ